MLTYKIKLQNTINAFEEFNPILLNISDDLNYIHGITNYNSLLSNSNKIFIRINNSNEYNEYSIKINNRICRGYILFKQKYKINHYNYNGTDVYGFKFADGNKYIFDFDGNLTMESLFIPNSKQNNIYGFYDEELFDKGIYEFHEIKNNVTEIEILTKYYIYDSIVNIGGIDYEVDYDSMSSMDYEVDTEAIITTSSQKLDYNSILTENNGEVVYDSIETVGDMENSANYSYPKPQIVLRNNEILDVLGYDKKFKICEFIIYKNQDYTVNVEHVSFTKPYYYIEYGSSLSENSYITPNKLYIKYSISNDEQTYYLNNINDINENFNYYLFDDNQKKIFELTKDNFDINKSINEIIINGEIYEIYEEWKNTSSGNKIHLYLNDNYYFEDNQSILVKSFNDVISEISVYSENDKEYVVINGVKYYIENNPIFLMVYNDNEYEILHQEYTYYDDNGDEIKNDQYFILYDNKPILIHINKTDNGDIESAYRLLMTENGEVKYTYQVNKYQYVIIDNKKYYIYMHQKILYDDNGNTISKEYKVINYLNNKPLKLFIENIIGSNQLRCSVIGDLLDDSDTLYGIVKSHQNYSFELYNPLINSSYNDNTPTNLQSYINDQYHFFYDVNNINIPILINNINGTNLFQEYVCETQFYDVEEKKAINSIIDMEKDIYYPGYYDAKTEQFYNVDEIIFDLHFRTRDLSEWKINNDIYDQETSDMVGCNWNIIDYYNNNETNVNNPNLYKPYFNLNDYKFYQPSDLLYFLNFTDDDVFYQKSKIGKSFLRLSFYDSIDPRNQNLLTTSTVFMNEGNLYNIFINNKVDSDLYISVDKIDNKNNRQISKNIRTNYELVEMDERATLNYSDDVLIFPTQDEVYYYPIKFNEEKRLSSSFTIKNMFESSESSEGFYLYLFREYSSGIHEKTIYLKVEFNHAGVGRTINFTQPFKLVNNERKMLDLSIEEDLALLKKGCKLQDLYDNMYIPIKIKYDFNNKKYYYYLPDWLTENNLNNDGSKKISEMRFNLYELKIANDYETYI